MLLAFRMLARSCFHSGEPFVFFNHQGGGLSADERRGAGLTAVHLPFAALKDNWD